MKGICVTCSHPGCSSQFHPLCAKFAEWYFDFDGDNPTIFCPAHTPEGCFK